MLRSIFIVLFTTLASAVLALDFPSDKPVKMAYFEVDVTPSIGSPLAFGTAKVIRDSLSARGIILVYDDKPVVVCAVDWIGIANDGLTVFRNALAEAANTVPDRVSVHALHQHNAVRCDFLAPQILDQYGDSRTYYDVPFLYKSIERVADAVREAFKNLQPVTHYGYGEAKVSRVASNRRILDHYGKVENMRWSNTTDNRLIRESEGVIDPWLRMVTLYNENQPLISMSYYAVHPVTEFGNGEVSAEFVGIARKYQEKKRGYPQIYFTGAAGNIGVGKYNHGAARMKYVLASRISMAMDQAQRTTTQRPLQRSDVKWKTTRIFIPLAEYVKRDSLTPILSGEKHDPELPYLRAAASMAWLERSWKDPYIRLSALQLGDIQLLSLPGEPFVEYQLAAQNLFPDQKICTAAYEEYGPGYIGTFEGYRQGGYETSKMASRLSPAAEKALMKGIEKVLE